MKRLLSVLLITLLLISFTAADTTKPSVNVYNVTEHDLVWSIENLSKDFNTDNYIRAGIAWLPVKNGSKYPSQNELLSVKAPKYCSGRDINNLLEGLDTNTEYVLYAFAQAANGLYYNVGEVKFRTDRKLNIPTPKLEYSNAGLKSISVSVESPTGELDNVFVNCYRKIDGRYMSEQKINAIDGKIQKTLLTFANLDSNTEYLFTAYCTFYDNNDTQYGFSTDELYIKTTK